MIVRITHSNHRSSSLQQLGGEMGLTCARDIHDAMNVGSVAVLSLQQTNFTSETQQIRSRNKNLLGVELPKVVPTYQIVEFPESLRTMNPRCSMNRGSVCIAQTLVAIYD
jgi:hypothetical protein